jgi:hypothetical protein
VWESVTFRIKELWAEAMDFAVDRAINAVAAIAAGTAKATGKGDKEAARVGKEAAADLMRIAESFGLRHGKLEPPDFGPSEEDIARLEALRKKAEESGAAFGEEFDKNLAKNRANFDEMLAQVAEALNLDIATKPGGKKGPDGSKENPFIVQDPNIGKGGAFEDLLSLQKRIQSAAFKTPEVFAIDAQTAMMSKNHKEQLAKLDQIKDNTKDTVEETEKNTKAVKDQDPAGTFS